GSGGGASLSGEGGEGGGVIILEVSYEGELWNDGNITADGNSGGCPGGGGGAGGSVLVKLAGGGRLSGSGMVTANGGNACSDGSLGGGGSGGRVAIFAWDADSFLGSLLAEGGWQGNSDLVLPAAGTVLTNFTSGAKEGTTLKVRNTNAYALGVYSTKGITLLNESMESSSSIDTNGVKLDVQEGGMLTVTDSANVKLSKILPGDGSGVLTIADHAQMQSSATTSGNLTVKGVQLVINGGSMAGWTIVTVESGGILRLSSNGNAKPETGGVPLTPNGTYVFDMLVIADGGRVDVAPASNVLSLVNNTSLVSIRAGTIMVASGGILTGNGYGYPATERDTSALDEQNIPYSGTASNGRNGGAGGGHAGAGANGYLNSRPGGAYDSTFAPTQSGGGGGAGAWGSGGAGGSAIHLVTTGDLIVQGQVSVDGESATVGSGGGGGAGGSLWVDCGGLLIGEGIISAKGGDGDGGLEADSRLFGGAGSGGRILLLSKDTSSFLGQVKAMGG
ncbi:unnamed protein product, partial [Choristocarpus tenellus]